MLVDELGAIVNLVVDDDVDVLLGVVLSNVLVGELLGSHFDDVDFRSTTVWWRRGCVRLRMESKAFLKVTS